MTTLVIGATGMLGSRVVAELQRRGMEYAEGTRDENPAYDYRLDLSFLKPGDVVINCAGVTSDRLKPPAEMMAANAGLPYTVALAAEKPGAKVIHVSTDCVFSGVPTPRNPGRRYSAVLDRPDPIDLYGRSKLAGEVHAPHVTNVRTSFVGPEHGLLAWLMAHKGETVDGWERAMWTGSTVGAVATALVDMAMSEEAQPNVGHLATAEKLSKAEALDILSEHYGLDVRVRRSIVPGIDRALEPTWELLGLRDALAGWKCNE